MDESLTLSQLPAIICEMGQCWYPLSSRPWMFYMNWKVLTNCLGSKPRSKQNLWAQLKVGTPLSHCSSSPAPIKWSVRNLEKVVASMTSTLRQSRKTCSEKGIERISPLLWHSVSLRIPEKDSSWSCKSRTLVTGSNLFSLLLTSYWAGVKASPSLDHRVPQWSEGVEVKSLDLGERTQELTYSRTP